MEIPFLPRSETRQKLILARALLGWIHYRRPIRVLIGMPIWNDTAMVNSCKGTTLMLITEPEKISSRYPGLSAPSD